VARANEIKIDDYTYAPIRTTVSTGTKVKFTNNGATPHNATSSDGGGWDTGLLTKGESATVTFNRPGTYTYICTPHPSMIGQIIVTGQALADAPATVVEGPATPRLQQTQHGAH
jgi:plastocyanin